MANRDLTDRQRLVQALSGGRHTAQELAGLLGIRARDVEDHLAHVVKSMARDRGRRVVLEPARCLDCGYVFRGRSRLTTPSRCPRCKSEGVTPPRFGITSLEEPSSRGRAPGAP